MGAEFSECHCKADSVRVTHRPLVTSYREHDALSVSVFRGETLTFDGCHGTISCGDRRVGAHEPGVHTRLFLVTATDASGWTVIYPDPRVWVDAEFDPMVHRLGCDALFGFYSEKTFMWSWAEYRGGTRVGSCLYVQPGV
jgi:hypothetical protein